MFVVRTGSIGWMLALAAVMAAEKNLPGVAACDAGRPGARRLGRGDRVVPRVSGDADAVVATLQRRPGARRTFHSQRCQSPHSRLSIPPGAAQSIATDRAFAPDAAINGRVSPRNFAFPSSSSTKTSVPRTSTRHPRAAAAIEGRMEILGVTSYGGPITVRAATVSRVRVHPVDRRRGVHAGPEVDPAVLNCAVYRGNPFKNEIPIYLYGETRTSRHIPNDILRELHGFIHTRSSSRGTSSARRRRIYGFAGAAVLPRAGRVRAGRLLFMALPEASGGVAFLKSGPDVPPVLRREHASCRRLQFRRRAGQLLDHSGPVAAAERNAARIFNADHFFFVTNGTSASNKMVWHATWHRTTSSSHPQRHVDLHAITMTGRFRYSHADAKPPRHHWPDPAGGVHAGEHQEEDRRIRSRAWRRTSGRRSSRSQSTYDGRVQRRDAEADARQLHRDAAFRRGMATAAFTVLQDMHAIRKDRPRSEEGLVFATHSTHKLLAGISQASQISCRNRKRGSSISTSSANT